MSEAPFELWEPRHGETPVVVEVPHAGLAMDPGSMALCRAPVEALVHDADLYVDELAADATDEGATLLVANMSRYVVDLNRDPDEADHLAVEGGAGESRPWGLLWRSTTRGDPALDGPVRASELERRLALAYWPYHNALQAVVRKKLARFGVAIVLSLHSMPSEVRAEGSARSQRVADAVVGTLGKTTAAAGLIAEVERVVRAGGRSVAHDEPYAGGATTRRYGRPGRGLHAIQVELARRLYMSERSCMRVEPGFAATRELCRGLVARLGAVALP